MDPDQLASLEGSQPTFTSKKKMFLICSTKWISHDKNGIFECKTI